MQQFNQKVNKNYVKLTFTFTNEFEKYFSKYFKTLLKKDFLIMMKSSLTSKIFFYNCS